ncbi:MAG TPA: HipA domain-containing protein, partial [Burkholderiaceae bacterium]|nr:HipA domain-containing protein [Burkholderiaceae bacterium]
FPLEQDAAAGAVDDARPDRWGERVIRFLDKPPRLSTLEYLYFAGDDRFGALGVSPSPTEYRPRLLGPLPTVADAATVHELVRKIMAGEPIPAQLKRLVSPGATMGGARPKALFTIDGRQWVIKFADEGDPFDTPLVEHATMTLAQRAGIRTAETSAIRLPAGHAVAIRRFDRVGARRLHALSANVALRAAAAELGYPDLALLLRRRGAVDVQKAHCAELFRRMVFNILIDNTDDHEKNHALLMRDNGQYELSPAFDVVPAGQGLGQQQFRVGAQQADATLENALSEAASFGLAPAEAEREVRKVSDVVAQWRTHFAAAGVSKRDLDGFGEHIDRPFLRAQREAWQTRRARTAAAGARRAKS